MTNTDTYDALAAEITKANRRVILATVKLALYQPRKDVGEVTPLLPRSVGIGPTPQEQVLLDERALAERSLQHAITNALRQAASSGPAI